MKKTDRLKLVESMSKAGVFVPAKRIYLEKRGYRPRGEKRIVIPSEEQQGYQRFEKALIKELACDEGIEELIDLLEELIIRNTAIVEYSGQKIERKKDISEV